jgi:hypothetical protein
VRALFLALTLVLVPTQPVVAGTAGASSVILTPAPLVIRDGVSHVVSATELGYGGRFLLASSSCIGIAQIHTIAASRWRVVPESVGLCSFTVTDLASPRNRATVTVFIGNP